MTHTRAMADHEGDFGPAVAAGCPCRKCKGRDVVVEDWHSDCGGYVDEKYTCRTCNHVWWVDGPDA